MTQKHPITPPRELVDRLQDLGNLDAIELAFQAGADQELEACCEWLSAERGYHPSVAADLRTGRRPKPPSLKEQALAQVESFACSMETLGMDSDLIRRALEALPE